MTVFGGDEIFAADLNALAMYTYGTTEPTNNTTTLSSDLAVTVPGAGRYALDGALWFRSTTAADLKVTLVGGGGVASANLRWGIEGSQVMAFGAGTLNIAVGATGFCRALVQGYLDNSSGSAGTITLQYAQQTADAGPTGPLGGRWLHLRELP